MLSMLTRTRKLDSAIFSCFGGGDGGEGEGRIPADKVYISLLRGCPPCVFSCLNCFITIVLVCKVFFLLAS